MDFGQVLVYAQACEKKGSPQMTGHLDPFEDPTLKWLPFLTRSVGLKIGFRSFQIHHVHEIYLNICMVQVSKATW